MNTVLVKGNQPVQLLVEKNFTPFQAEQLMQNYNLFVVTKEAIDGSIHCDGQVLTSLSEAIENELAGFEKESVHKFFSNSNAKLQQHLNYIADYMVYAKIDDKYWLIESDIAGYVAINPKAKWSAEQEQYVLLH